MEDKIKKIDIWHNILWAKYKGVVFSALHEINNSKEFDIRFFQMAETEGNRKSLSAVDESYHTYPYTLIFKGALDQVPFHKRLAALAKAAWTTDADLCVLTGYEKPEVWAQLLILKLRRKKTIFFCDATIHDQPQNVLKNFIKTILFRSVDGVFGYGVRARDYVFGFEVKPENWYKRCQAAALSHDYSEAKALKHRMKMATPKGTPRFLYVGRLSPEKNLHRLLEAFQAIKDQMPKAELVIVGGGTEEKALKDKATALGLDAKAILVGSKNGQDLYDEYAKATCFVLPSLSEPWGLVVNEALHYGCPVIVSERCGCVPELVVEGETGFAHDPENIDDLIGVMRKAVDAFADTEKTAKVCLNLMQNYTPSIAAEQMLTGIGKIFVKS